MLDFTELSKDGQDLELLVRELLLTRGIRCYWSGKGPDGGRDLLAVEERSSFFAADSKRWLIQCKHNAHGGGSVGVGDLDDILDSCVHHDADGYLLVCSTQPSSGVVDRLEAITKNAKHNITAIYWDAVRIEQLLTTPRYWRIAQRFFPVSSSSSTLDVFATENPNHWVVNYKGYYFHLTNRIGSKGDHHFASIDQRIADIQRIALPADHFIRIRSVYYDDKNGNYQWYLDYMYPLGERASISSTRIAFELGHECVLEDGQFYYFDVIVRPYSMYSDHYDPDHYDYYRPYIDSYLRGQSRTRTLDETEERFLGERLLEDESERLRHGSFEALHAALQAVPSVRVVRACNAEVESLPKFHLLRDWAELIQDLALETDRFFSAWILLECEDTARVHELVRHLPQEGLYHFRLTKPFIYLPTDDGRAELDGDDDLFELTVSIHPALITDMVAARKELNTYFDRLAAAINDYVVGLA